MTLSVAHGIWTACLLVAFIGIVAWSYSRRRRDDFETAARIPLDEPEESGNLPGDPTHD